MATPVAFIDQLGIHAPTYQEVLDYLTQQYKSIYGEDVYLGNDSQDQQWLAVVASAIHDAISMAVSVYSAFSPSTAQGKGLSSVVRINNIRRSVPTNSTADLQIIGQAGVEIQNGVVRDGSNQNWLLPPLVTIPTSGDITVTAIAANSGAVAAAANDIKTILTPTRGWQSATNPLPAVQGDPLESDVALRRRQTISTALPSQAIKDGMLGGVARVPGVLRAKVYENDTDRTNNNGLPSHSVSFVVDGGDAQEIAQAIMLRKPPGSSTYGAISETILNSQGLTDTVSFFRPTPVPISVEMVIDPLVGYTTSTGQKIINAMAAYITALDIGTDVYRKRLFLPANLYGTDPASQTYNIESMTISRGGAPTGNADVVIAFNEAPISSADNIILTVLVHG